ncbi:MAG TPA: Uma2 family endonuclease [Thermoanaerobaculia bacterium]|nr:Uma2 family endonuclease [Thermoanaerobaculia bacterium]
MSVHAKPTRSYLSAEEYLALDRSSDVRSEYIDGEMVAMAGGSWEHSLIIGNALAELKQQLRGGPCTAHASDLRVQAPNGLRTYSDVVVVCGEPAFADEHRDTVTSPKLIIEVLSPTTESYDRGRKFESYRTIPFLEEYVLISQERPRVERFLRQPDSSWLFIEVAGLPEAIALPSLGCRLSLEAIYEGVEFP